MVLRQVKYILVVLVAMTFAMGCTRKADPKQKFVLKIPSQMKGRPNKVGAQSTITLMHIVVNVHNSASGGGVLAVWNWDACSHNHGNCDASSAPPPPPFIELDVPSGSGRLVQFLGAGQDASGTSSGYVFSYDDAVVDLIGSEASVSVTPVVMGVTGAQGNLNGRFLTSASGGPTGPMQVFIQPPNGKPKMLLEDSYMYNGFFESFYLDGAGFQFYLPEQGISMFGGDFNSANLVTSQSLAAVNVPSFYRQRSDMGMYWAEREEAGKIFVGYFTRPGEESFATGKKVYKPTAGSVISKAYLNFTGINPTSNASDFANPLNWVSVISDATTQIGVLSGGATGTVTGSEFVDYFNIDPSIIGDRGTHDFVRRRGPYVEFQTGPSSSYNYGHFDAIQKRVVAGVANVEWKYLPNITADPTAVSGTRIFYNDDPAMDFEMFRGDMGDGVMCHMLEYFGFPSVDVMGSTQEATLTVANPNNLNVVLCPLRQFASGGGVFMAPLGANSHWYNSMSGPTMSPYLEIVDGSGNPFGDHILQGSNAGCVTAKVVRYNGSGVPDTSGTMTVSLGAGGASIFGTTAACPPTSSPSGTATIPAGSSEGTFYIDTSNSLWANLSANGAAGYMPGYKRLAILNSSLPSPTMLNLDIQGAYAVGECYRGGVELASSTFPTNYTSDIVVNLDYISHPDFEFYDNPNCTGPVASSVMILAGENRTDYWFKPLTVGSGLVHSFNTSTSMPSVLTGMLNSINVGAATPSNYNVFTNLANNQFDPGECFSVGVEARNANGASFAMDVARTINMSVGSGALFYADSTCSGTGTSTASGTYNAGDYHGPQFYMKANSGASMIMSLTASDTSSHSGTAGSIMVAQPQLVVSPSSIIGVASACQNFTVDLKDRKGQPYLTGSTVNLNFNFDIMASSGSLAVYEGGGCTVQLGTPANAPSPSGSGSFAVPANQSSASFSIQASGTAITILNLTINGFSIPLAQ